ncbi:MAG: hypothetical protein HND48_11705 [Chloroflexi bacterium]|nr:hypothetical protein [Chloroflexota bacterium]
MDCRVSTANREVIRTHCNAARIDHIAFRGRARVDAPRRDTAGLRDIQQRPRPAEREVDNWLCAAKADRLSGPVRDRKQQHVHVVNDGQQ